MKKVALALALVVAVSSIAVLSDARAAQFSFGLNRDAPFIIMNRTTPCVFPPVCSPKALPCRPPGVSVQKTTAAYQSACPSKKLPYYGVSYTDNPYPLFQ